MKYVVLLAVLVIAYLVWRNGRIKDSSGARGPSRPVAGPQEMVACATCGLHLPQSDALFGSNGLPYCSQEHRLRSGT
jgi:uncharacterized protein